MTGHMYTCVSVTWNFLREYTHNTSFFKVEEEEEEEESAMI